MHIDENTPILFSKKEIQSKVKRLASIIENDYKEKDLVVISILKGSIFFTSDLLKNISLDVQLDFLTLKSYESTTSTGAVVLHSQPTISVKNKHVLIVEDIIDTGNTIDFIKHYFTASKCASIKFCTLIDKTERREVLFTPEYSVFTIPKGFVVGYGLDYNEKYRNLEHIYILD